MPSKRSAQRDESHGRVRKKVRSTGGALLETTSIEERAEPFRLMTVRFPIDDVTPEWSTGCNRDINEKHVKQLCRLFEEYGLDRLDRAHRLSLLCNAQDVRLMCERIGIDCRPNDPGASPPSFKGWRSATAGTAEVLAGNHRIGALKAYLKQQKLTDDDEERWWVCNIFDRDALPLELQIELRANRGGTVLPDTHGQIWTELRTWAEQDESGSMFSGARGDIEEQMNRALKLNTREQFPVRRLAILWKNDRWRKFVSRLCNRRAGRDIFNISTFQKLSSYRIDDYLFERIESIIRPLDVIWEEFGIELELERDYSRLAGLHRRWKPRELFYPKDHNELDIDEDSSRRSQFLLPVDNSKYHALYRYLAEKGRELAFPDAHELLKTLNSRGKTMQAVMTHVVMWLNNDLVSVNDREGNKPPLAEELLSVVSSMPEMAVGWDLSIAAKAKVLEVQRRVLMYVEKNAAAFTRDDLSLLPEAGVEPKTYQGRFRFEVWRDILARVREVIGPRFRNPCVSNFNTEAVRRLLQPSKLSFADALQDLIIQHPEIAGNPTLKSSEAKEALGAMMEKAVAQWKQQYRQGWTGLQPQDEEPRSAAIIPDLAPIRKASSFETSSVDEQNGHDRETGSTRVSASTHGQVARWEHTRGSLFIEPSESEGQLESPKAPEARVHSFSPHTERDNSTRPMQSFRQARPSTTVRSFSEDDEQAERGPSPFWNPSLAKTITARKVHRLQRKEAATVSASSETLQKASTLGSAPITALPTKPHVKPQSDSVRVIGAAQAQQRHGWRTRPLAGA